jgi:signal transduction histidine kinase
MTAFCPPLRLWRLRFHPAGWRVAGALVLLLAAGGRPARAEGVIDPPLPTLDSIRARLTRPGLPDKTRVLYLIRACGLLSTTDLVAARRYGEQSVALAHHIGFLRGEASALANLAAMYYYASDYPAAQRTFEAALSASQRAGMQEQIGHAYLGLGNVAQALHNIPRALRHFEQARQAYAAVDPPSVNGQMLVLNNTANAYNALNQPERAGRAFRRALALARPDTDAHLVVGVLDGLAGFQQGAGHLDSAEATLLRGLSIARQTHDLRGEAGLRGRLSEMMLNRQQPERARLEAERTLAMARQVGDPFVQEDMLRILAAALRAQRQSAAYDTLLSYLALHDTLMAQERTDAIIEAQARFDAAGQRARIRELEQQHLITSLGAERTKLRNRWVFGWVALGVVILTGGFVWSYRRRKARDEAALRARLAADLHDDVGSLLTQLTIQSGLLRENAYTAEQQRARLDRLADTSRRAALQLIDVVWSLDAANDTFTHLLERLREHAHDVLGSAEIGVDFIVDSQVESARFAPEIRQHIYLIFKEALHNIIKHAHATRVSIRLAIEGRFLILHIHDDGQRAPAVPHRPAGRGLSSMQARAQAVKGTVTIGAEAAGFGVLLRVPR